MKINANNRQQFLLVLTAAVVALWIGSIVIYTPLANSWSARSKQIKDLRDKVRDGNLMKQREGVIRSEWNNMRDNALPANPSLAEQQVLNAFDNWKHSSGVEISSIMPQWKSDSTNYLTLACHVEAAGDISTLGQFLYDIEKGPMALKIDSAELSGHDASGQQLTLGLDINGLALLNQPTKK